MNVTTSNFGTTMRPDGDLDQEGCLLLQNVISTALSAGVRDIVLDLSEVTHLELEAVQMMRGVQAYLDRHGGGLALIHPSSEATRALHANGLLELLVLVDRPMPAFDLEAC